MTPSQRRLCAGFAVLGVIAPWWAAAGITLHVLVEHNDLNAVSLDAFLHGHRHSAGTPDHEHTLFAPSSQGMAPVGAASYVLLQRGGIAAEVVAATLKVSNRAIAGPAFASGADPPWGISPLRI